MRPPCRLVCHDGGQQRALADPIAADDRQSLAGFQRQPDILQHHRLAVAGADIVEFERALSQGSSIMRASMGVLPEIDARTCSLAMISAGVPA